MPIESIRVLLADDYVVVRKDIREFLTRPGDIAVIAEASNGDEALALLEQEKPDVAVLDIQLPKRTGIEVCHHVRAQHWSIGILILSAYDDDPYVLAVLQAGAMRGLFTPQALDLPAFAADLHASSDLHVVLLDQAARPIFHDDTAHVNFDPVAVLGQRSGVNRSLRSESGYGPQGIRYYR